RICACLGMLTEEEGRLLAEAGVDRYNHNLNTAESHHDEIVTTHTYEDRKKTIGAARHAGLSVCSGIIVGMGETTRQLVEVAFEVRDSGADSIPVNFLLPVAGTTLGDRDPGLTPTFCLKVLAMFRFVCPDREIRVSAGRETHLKSLQPMALYAANSLFVSDYLTEPGQDPGLDHGMIEDLGFTVV
ncbi:MAG: biotin synthase BioB, partial [Planctomycetota bacterium]